MSPGFSMGLWPKRLGGSRFPIYYFSQFSRKLHGIKKNRGRRTSLAPPLDPPLKSISEAGCLFVLIPSNEHRVMSRLFTWGRCEILTGSGDRETPRPSYLVTLSRDLARLPVLTHVSPCHNKSDNVSFNCNLCFKVTTCVPKSYMLRPKVAACVFVSPCLWRIHEDT